jgi:lipopolysaccharide biosynthesis glycosyltransferase
MKDKNIIHIVCAPDDNYAQHCAVMLASLFRNNRDEKFHIHILHAGLKSLNINRLKSLITQFNGASSFYVVSKEDVAAAPITHHVSIATYFRFFAPKLLPDSIEKVLYLDADLLVRKNISALWSTPLGPEEYVAAVNECVSAEHKKLIGIKEDSPYFNAGVMLVHLKKWREENISDSAIKYIANNPSRIVYWDQDVMNVLFEGKWRSLNYCWNVSHFFYTNSIDSEYFNLSKEDYVRIKTDPYILHFSGHVKPWNYKADHPLKKEYYTYLESTPWRGFKGFGAPTITEKLLYYIKHRIIKESKLWSM